MPSAIQQMLLGTSAAGGGGGFGAEANAFLARTSGLDATHTNAYGALIDGLVADSIWSKLDMLHIYATQDSTTALLNLVSTSFNGTANGSPTFTTDRGYTGATGTSVYINPGFQPSAGGHLYTANSCHASAWSLTNSNSGTAILGCFDSANGTNTDIYPQYSDNNAYGRINSGAIAGVSVADSLGHYISNRPDSTTAISYKDGSSILSNGSAAATTLSTRSILILSLNSNGTVAGSPRQVAMASIGAGLTGTDATNFYNRLRTFMTAVGVP